MKNKYLTYPSTSDCRYGPKRVHYVICIGENVYEENNNNVYHFINWDLFELIEIYMSINSYYPQVGLHILFYQLSNCDSAHSN